MKNKIKTEFALPEITLKIICFLTFLIFFLSASFTAASDELPKPSDFEAHKRSFYALMYPIVVAENQNMINLRKKIQSAVKQGDKTFISKAKQQFRLKNTDSIERLLKRVDMIPPELVLAQSALETDWGRSRFAREGNNMFGQWCYAKDCGMVPKERIPGQTHEVAVYPSIQASVKSYLINLNTHKAYKKFRAIRLRLRKSDKQPDALLLAEGLGKYSRKGIAYIQSIQKMIRSNQYLLAEISQ